MTPPSPNLLPIENYAIMDARHRKLLKLEIMKEKSLARRREEQENTVDLYENGQNSQK